MNVQKPNNGLAELSVTVLVEVRGVGSGVGLLNGLRIWLHVVLCVRQATEGIRVAMTGLKKLDVLPG